jgi:hypothetical protein
MPVLFKVLAARPSVLAFFGKASTSSGAAGGRAALEAHEAGDAILLFTIFAGNARVQTIVKMTQDSKRTYFTRYKFD